MSETDRAMAAIAEARAELAVLTALRERGIAEARVFHRRMGAAVVVIVAIQVALLALRVCS